MISSLEMTRLYQEDLNKTSY